MTLGRATTQEVERISAKREDEDEEEEDSVDEMGQRGHILWVRGLSRLQHQVRKVHPAASSRLNAHATVLPSAD